MRVFLAITLLIAAGAGVRSDQPDQAIEWQKPFGPISASRAADALVLVLITNEDPFVTAESTHQQTRRNRKDTNKLSPPVWCAEVLSRAYRQAIDRRADLVNRFSVQSIAAGLPKELTGGKPRNTPARAVLAICDGNYRLLSLTVGVPDVDEMLTLIEDAQDVAAMRQLSSATPSRIVHLIAQRSGRRIDRVWQGVLEEMVVAMQGDAGGDQVDGPGTEEHSLAARFRLLSETFDPIYFADVRLRFGLTDSVDRKRLVVLEQHPEARRSWCEAMIPFAAGTDFSETWRDLVESIWGHQPITADADAKDLLDWFDLQNETDAVVLSLRPPARLQYVPWPPILDQGAKRGIGWQGVHALAMEHPFRSVDAQQLALLIRSRDLMAVDIQRPTMARYLLIETGKKSPYVAREGDPPGRLAGLLKRSKSKLVK